MEFKLTDEMCVSIKNKEKKETVLYMLLALVILGFTIYCIRALLIAVANTDINSILWFLILFIETVVLLYFILKVLEHVKPILGLRRLENIKSYEVGILDIDMAWCFDTILFRPCSLMELSWKEEESLVIIEWKKEKEIADVVRKALLLYNNDILLGAYVLNENGEVV